MAFEANGWRFESSRVRQKHPAGTTDRLPAGLLFWRPMVLETDRLAHAAEETGEGAERRDRRQATVDVIVLTGMFEKL